MNCRNYELVLMDVARGAPEAGGGAGAALDHAGRCPRCAAMLADQRELSRGLRTLARTADVPPGASLQARLLMHWNDDHVIESRAVWPAALRVAAAIVLVAGGLFAAWREVSLLPPRPPAPSAAGFVIWPGAATLPPFESGELVRTELPVAALPALGLPVPLAPRETVTADLLVAQDGLVRAVRLAK
jgi:hypothetical protein